MIPTLGQRIVALRTARNWTQEELATQSGVSRSRIAVIEKDRKGPPQEITLSRLAGAFGITAAELRGSAAVQKTLTIVEEPAAPFTPAAPVVANPDVVTAFLGQMAEMARNHRDEVQALKKEARKDLRAQAETYDYTINRMAADFDRERAELKQRIFDMELRLGLRQPTAEEAQLMAQQAQPATKKVKGLRSYEEEVPEAAEALMALSYSNPSFTRPPVLEEEVSHLQAA